MKDFAKFKALVQKQFKKMCDSNSSLFRTAIPQEEYVPSTDPSIQPLSYSAHN